MKKYPILYVNTFHNHRIPTQIKEINLIMVLLTEFNKLKVNKLMFIN